MVLKKISSWIIRQSSVVYERQNVKYFRLNSSRLNLKGKPSLILSERFSPVTLFSRLIVDNFGIFPSDNCDSYENLLMGIMLIK